MNSKYLSAVQNAKKEIIVLGIESSCDETAAAVVADGRRMLSNVIASQIKIHQEYGGVVPEIASREHVGHIDGVVRDALKEAGCTLDDIDAIAVTYGPGLVGALLVGVSFAKALAFATDKPLVGVHHIEGHICANYIEYPDLEPPYVCLVASGGHSHLVLVKDYGTYEIIGATRDDAAGEAFDKVARVLGLKYPGGPSIDTAARGGDEHAFVIPHAKIPDAPYDFSFSGVKSTVLNLVNRYKMKSLLKSEQIDNKTQVIGDANQKSEDAVLGKLPVADIAASFQRAVVDVLSEHIISAAQEYDVQKVAIAGGVASNSCLRETLEKECAAKGFSFYRPSPILCTDNAAMIASAGYFAYERGETAGMNLNAMPNLPLGERERRFHAQSIYGKNRRN